MGLEFKSNAQGGASVIDVKAIEPVTANKTLSYEDSGKAFSVGVDGLVVPIFGGTSEQSINSVLTESEQLINVYKNSKQGRKPAGLRTFIAHLG